MRIIFLLFLYSTLKAQITGCTDPLAANYNSIATQNDGSCVYNSSTISPVVSHTINSILNETSGLIKFGNSLYTQNDDTDKNIYALDTLNGNIINTYSLSNLINIDWEEISQDNNYVYIGDFGNNANGNRTNLCIYKISKTSLLTNAPIIDTIKFSYSNQTNYTATGNNNTNFDCEAFIVKNDSIFLFTKQWVNNATSIYSLPKTAGTYTAQLKTTINVQGLITGATLLETKNLIVLCGYSNLLQPFFYLIYDYLGNNFTNCNKRKIEIQLPFHQLESITTTNGIKYFLTNEYFSNPPWVNTPQQLHIFNLSAFLNPYLNPTPNFIHKTNSNNNFIKIYPNPNKGELTINVPSILIGEEFKIYNLLGETLHNEKITNSTQNVNIYTLPKGIYFLKIKNSEIKKIIKE
jgi:hypothetical protein